MTQLRVLCVLGEHNYGDPARGEGYEFSNFVPALRRLGHEVAHFESFARAPYADFADLNRRLLARVEEFSPDLLFCVLMHYEVWIESLRLARASGVRLLNWSTDDSWKYRMFSRLIAREFDLFVTTFPDAIDWYRKDGIESVRLSQWAANADALAGPLPARECRYAVSFVGSAYGDRPAIVEALRGEGIEVACFGQGWPAGPVDAPRIPEIVRSSQVSLNFSAGSRGEGAHARQIKARVFEVPGYGGCLLTEGAPYLERYFRVGTEIESFNRAEDLAAKVRALLAEPDRRDDMARRGFERVRAEHTYDRRFAPLLDELQAQKPARPRRTIEWQQFEAAARRHACGPGLRALRRLMTTPTNLVWGGERGPRAARRALFEASWRTVGATTFTAAGWPGRLFYRES